ncbi:MAG TPA: aryl-sulfate sulfotransferase [Bryobacteraceae bacterium]|nr:aryl-sulfate sulfotransferase [Bryobacteraceae bacterium]
MRSTMMFVVAAVASLPVCWSAPSVRIVPALVSPQPVGTVIGLVAVAKEDGDPFKVLSKLRFRFSVSVDGSPFRVVRDFSSQATCNWRPDLFEHQARVKVTLKNIATKMTAESELPFQIVPRVKGQQPVATPTANPLVALFSAPPCPQGSRFRAAFRREGDSGEWFHTGIEPCSGARTNNIYVAGMLADSNYEMHAEILTGDASKPGTSVTFHTGIADGLSPAMSVLVPRDLKSSSSEPFLIYSVETPNQRPTATDLNGNLVWYLPSHERSLTRMLSGGRFLVLSGGLNEHNSRLQVLSEVDLAGNTIRETNIMRIAEQLEDRGIHSVCKPNGHQCIPGFHHEAIRLPNGHTIVIASLERMLPDGAQGSEDPIDVISVLLLDLDEDLQLKWYWNAFDHLDVSRSALSDEKCNGPVGGGGCSPVFLAPVANDWLHGNAVSYSRADGNLTLSLPEQDWVIKIDYQDGKGSGKVVWRLGEGGDLKLISSEKFPWFSYEHDAGFEPPGSDVLLLLDNGPRHKKKDPEAHTRGQYWKIDEKARTATLVMNADLGVYSPFVGSAQRLSNGNFHFNTGAVMKDASFGARSIEITPEGKIVYSLETTGALVYRSNRIPDLYTPPVR